MLQEKLQAPDLLVHLQWWAHSVLAFRQLEPLGLKLEGRFAPGRDQSPTNIHVGVYRWINGHLEDGQQISTLICRLCNEKEIKIYGRSGEIGDWVVLIKVGDRTRRSYKFVWPRSKSFPLPPVGNQWIYVRKGDEHDHSEPGVTFEVVSINAN